MVSARLPLVLGSASAARLATLRRAGVMPYVLVSDVDEDAVVIAEVFAKRTRATPGHVVEICQKRLRDYDDA